MIRMTAGIRIIATDVQYQRGIAVTKKTFSLLNTLQTG